MEQLQSALGIVALIAFAWIISENRRAVAWRSVAAGLAATFVLAALLLKVPQVKGALAAVNGAVDAIDRSPCHHQSDFTLPRRCGGRCYLSLCLVMVTGSCGWLGTSWVKRH
jgi:hypothetical protein